VVNLNRVPKGENISDQEKATRGIDIRFLSVEQNVEQMNDEDLFEAIKGFDSLTRGAIKAAGDFSALDRDSYMKAGSTAKAENDAEELVSQQILNWLSFKPEVLARLNRAVDKVDEFDKRNQ